MAHSQLYIPLNPEEASEPAGALSWKSIDYRAAGKHILKSIDGKVSPGRLCAIMGPSGAGKSTLLNCLAGRIHFEGAVFFNREKINPVDFRRHIAYVMQEDALLATQTPREALAFSAALRLPSQVTPEERKRLVAGMLLELGLNKCADTFIGSIMIKGISGGEKKRTAVGCELISSPKILFLDEPTSGLDSFAAFNVVKILKNLTDSAATTVICTIHQPSSEVFHLFDDALLLADGRLIYHAAVDDMLGYFKNHGHGCKANYNPADFVMFMMQQSSEKELTTFASTWADWTLTSGNDGREETKTTAQTDGDVGAVLIKKLTSGILHPLHRIKGSRANLCTQFYHLAIREGKNVFRDRRALAARYGMTIFLNIIVAFVFKGAADWRGDVEKPAMLNQKLQNHFGAVTQIAIGGMFGLAQPMLLHFPLERPVFLREYATGTYGVIPYFASKLLIEVPMAIFQSLVVFLVTYWIVGFQGNFVILLLYVALLGLTAASTALLVGSAASNVQVAIQMSPILFLPQVLFAGFFISTTQIPSFMRWIQYLCALKYGVNLLMITEFKDLPDNWPSHIDKTEYYLVIYGCADPHDYKCDTVVNDQALYPRSNVTPRDEWVYIGVLVAVFTTFRVLALLILSNRARRV